MYLEHEQFAGCCGAIEIYDFGNNPNDNIENFSVGEVEEELKNVLANYNVRGKAMVIVTLVAPQNIKYKRMLTRNGFKCLSEGYHPRHRSVIYLWVKSYKKGSKRPKARKSTPRDYW